MKVAVTALFFAEWYMNINHKKSPEQRSSNLSKLILLISVTSHVDEVVEIITNANHETVSAVILDIRQS